MNFTSISAIDLFLWTIQPGPDKGRQIKQVPFTENRIFARFLPPSPPQCGWLFCLAAVLYAFIYVFIWNFRFLHPNMQTNLYNLPLEQQGACVICVFVCDHRGTGIHKNV